MIDAVNPYAQILRQARALLATESKMSPPQREPFSWMLHAEFLGTQCVVVKGGENTLIVQVGDEAREPMMPRDALDKLERLSRQQHLRYAIVRGDRRKFVPSLQDALAFSPVRGDRIVGTSRAGGTVTHVALTAMNGSTKWIKR